MNKYSLNREKEMAVKWFPKYIDTKQKKKKKSRLNRHKTVENLSDGSMKIQKQKSNVLLKQFN